MRKLLSTLLTLLFAIPAHRTDAQCIADIYYLESKPCLFIGTVSSENPTCFDIWAYPAWAYTWKISLHNGPKIAEYQGFSFAHNFDFFGRYDFCLEVDKDGLPETPPDIVDCQTFTTCEACGGADLAFEYLSCPVGSGCNVEMTANVGALNMGGVKPFAKLIFTYLPTPQELLGGVVSYDLTIPNIPVTFHAQDSLIVAKAKVLVPFARGCFKPRLVLELEYNAGAHSSAGGPPCTNLVIADEDVLRCHACNEPNDECYASIYATYQANQTGKCELFSCPIVGGRSDESDNLEESTPTLSIHSFPNPASNLLHLDFEGLPEGASLCVYDALGKRCFEENLMGSKGTRNLEVSSWLPGIYSLMAKHDGQVLYSGKVVILR